MITEILRKYGAGEITAEECNTQLKEANAGFSVDPEKNPSGDWTSAEIEEGFFDPSEKGFEVKKRVHHDEVMKRHTQFAGMTIYYQTTRGNFLVTYNENGYHYSSKRVDF